MKQVLVMKRLIGMHDDITGNVSGIWGDASGITGVVSDISGNVAGLSGDVTGIRGDVDAAEISSEERAKGVDISKLVIIPT